MEFVKTVPLYDKDTQEIADRSGQMPLAENVAYSLDSHKTGLNNNVLVVGASGAGKTRGIVIPNLLEATGSYIVSDPKGNLYERYGEYLRSQGYEVRKLDFTDPAHSAHYNFFNYIRCTQDIVKIAHMLIYQEKQAYHADPFWDQSSQLLMQAVISYLIETCPVEDRKFENMLKLLDCMDSRDDLTTTQTVADYMFEKLEKKNPQSFAVKNYKRFRCAAERTLRSILISVNSRIGRFESEEVAKLTSKDTIDIDSIGQKKTALFVVVSDTDRSMDGLINIFFTQTMNELCYFADKKCKDSSLPVPVRFILDDFATNCKIEEFPRMISSIRSRGISAMMMIQAESQLHECYGYDGRTVIGNCDTYVYLGGNDVETAQNVSLRCDVPSKKILNMPVGTNWIFRRGSAPYNGRSIDLDRFIQAKKIEGLYKPEER